MRQQQIGNGKTVTPTTQYKLIKPKQLQKFFPEVKLEELVRPKEIELLISHREGRLAPPKSEGCGGSCLMGQSFGKDSRRSSSRLIWRNQCSCIWVQNTFCLLHEPRWNMKRQWENLESKWCLGQSNYLRKPELRHTLQLLATVSSWNGGNGIVLGPLVNRCVEPVETVSQVGRRWHWRRIENSKLERRVLPM